ncbi:hypothetical protein L0128_16010 [candidate division KSB1 bacterium]|nr:hypothetical protein [candidate division KSB1 bacterium]
MRFDLMIWCFVFWFLFTLSTILRANPYQPIVQQIEKYYVKGDKKLQQAEIDSALFYYIKARTTVNEFFFNLLSARQAAQISKTSVTKQWDAVTSQLRIRLKEVDNCEFERCFIFREENAANWCLELIERGNPEQIGPLLQKLITILESDQRQYLKNFYGKIYYYLQLDLSLQNFHQTLFPNDSKNEALKAQIHKFLNVYWQYMAKK